MNGIEMRGGVMQGVDEFAEVNQDSYVKQAEYVKMLKEAGFRVLNIQGCDELVPRSRGERAAYLEGVQEGRGQMEAVAADLLSALVNLMDLTANHYDEEIFEAAHAAIAKAKGVAK